MSTICLAQCPWLDLTTYSKTVINIHRRSLEKETGLNNMALSLLGNLGIVMDLFSQKNDVSMNLLPYDGEVNYFGKVLDQQQSTAYFETLLKTIAWKNDEAVIFGKRIVTKRKVAWYGSEPFEYTYSKITKSALPWTPALLELKSNAEKTTGEIYNSCLLNLYHSGDEGMAWHSDAEKDLKYMGAIASMSFGATRRFGFKHKKTKETIYVWLEHGSLLLMKGATQMNWLHRLPPTTKVNDARINLTFRSIVRGK